MAPSYISFNTNQNLCFFNFCEAHFISNSSFFISIWNKDTNTTSTTSGNTNTLQATFTCNDVMIRGVSESSVSASQNNNESGNTTQNNTTDDGKIRQKANGIDDLNTNKNTEDVNNTAE